MKRDRTAWTQLALAELSGEGADGPVGSKT